ncbi:MAG: hypothetical protein ACK5U8_26660, partial [Deltaproteobacteria bacterium]
MRRALPPFALSLLLLVGGCYGPTLPLPPPTALVSAPDAEGTVTVTGPALPRAYERPSRGSLRALSARPA